jgi:hypothetical protein
VSEPRPQHRLIRHWPLLLPPAMWILLFAGLLRSEIVRAVLAVVCTGLMIFQWLIYRKTDRGTQLLLLSLVVTTLGLSSVWLGLNVVRFYTYDPESPQTWAWHTLIAHVQEIIEWVIVALASVVVLWGLLLVARWLNRRFFAAS